MHVHTYFVGKLLLAYIHLVSFFYKCCCVIVAPFVVVVVVILFVPFKKNIFLFSIRVYGL